MSSMSLKRFHGDLLRVQWEGRKDFRKILAKTTQKKAFFLVLLQKRSSVYPIDICGHRERAFPKFLHFSCGFPRGICHFLPEVETLPPAWRMGVFGGKLLFHAVSLDHDCISFGEANHCIEIQTSSNVKLLHCVIPDLLHYVQGTKLALHPLLFFTCQNDPFSSLTLRDIFLEVFFFQLYFLNPWRHQNPRQNRKPSHKTHEIPGS